MTREPRMSSGTGPHRWRELDSRQQFLHVGKEVEEAAQAWAEKLKLREMQREDAYAAPYFIILEKDGQPDAARRRMNKDEVEHPDRQGLERKFQSLLGCIEEVPDRCGAVVPEGLQSR